MHTRIFRWCLAAAIMTLAGCSAWPWGSLLDDQVPGNLPAGQQAYVPRSSAAPMERYDFSTR